MHGSRGRKANHEDAKDAKVHEGFPTGSVRDLVSQADSLLSRQVLKFTCRRDSLPAGAVGCFNIQGATTKTRRTPRNAKVVYE
jgi:hypothetical protein